MDNINTGLLSSLCGDGLRLIDIYIEGQQDILRAWLLAQVPPSIPSYPSKLTEVHPLPTLNITTCKLCS